MGAESGMGRRYGRRSMVLAHLSRAGGLLFGNTLEVPLYLGMSLAPGIGMIMRTFVTRLFLQEY